MGLFRGRVDITADYFHNRREDILIQRVTIPTATGFRQNPWQNFGIVDNKGLDGSLTLNHQFGDLKVSARGNITYVRNEIVEYDEVPSKYNYQNYTGQSIGQPYCYIAEGLYTPDDFTTTTTSTEGYLYELKADVPKPAANVAPGDIKYKDLNGDNIIDDNDQCPIGNPIYPQLTAGITAGFEYKGFDFSMLWAGSGKVSRFISAGLRVPFGGGNYGLLQYMIDDHWTPETAETAKTPRFSGAANANNYTRNSTLWLKDASYIRLKNVQIGYTFKGEWMKKIHLKNMRIYASGENLLTFDHLKIADPEATDDKQFQYPLQMIFNIGLNLNF